VVKQEDARGESFYSSLETLIGDFVSGTTSGKGIGLDYAGLMMKLPAAL
jgi:hypothetical protein